MINGSKRNILLLIVFSVFSILPLFQSGFFFPHDNEWHLIRLIELDKSIREGEYYARWLPDLASGYGLPVFNYYSPLVYYLAEVLHLAGLDFFNSMKGIYAIGFVSSGLAMYLFAKEILGEKAGLVAGIAYIYAPYHIADIYVRGALPEFFALTFFPLILWSVYKLIETNDKKYFFFSSVFYTLLILTHNLMALFLLPIYIFYYLSLLLISRKFNAKPILAFLMALGLSAFYWIPALAERKFIQSQNLLGIYKDHFVYPHQLFSIEWGYGFSVPGARDGMSFQIGLLYVYFIMVSLIFVLTSTKIKRTTRIHLLFFQSLTAISIFFMLEISAPLWQVLPYLAFSQFPWRFLAIVILSTSFLSGAVVAHFSEKVAVALSLLFVLTSFGYLSANFVEVDKSEYSPAMIRQMGTTTTVANEFLPVGVKRMPQSPADEFITANEDLKITILERKVNLYRFEVIALREVEMVINTFWFPGWKAYVDEKEIVIESRNEIGVIGLKVPRGKHEVVVRFESTPIRRLASLISALSFILLLASISKGWRKMWGLPSSKA